MDEKPKTVFRKDSSITIGFENVFPKIESDSKYVLFLDILNNLKEWQQVYQGKQLIYTIEGLPPCTPFNFRVKCRYSGEESEWVEFKSATDIDQYYIKHLSRAIEFQKMPLIRKLISCRPQLLEIENDKIKTPLVQSIEIGNLKLIQFLLLSGANVNQKLRFTNKTALLVAFTKGNLEIIKYLVRKKADVSSTDINGLNGLHYAVDSNIAENVRFAVNANFQINEKDNKGWTPLLRAGKEEKRKKCTFQFIF